MSLVAYGCSDESSDEDEVNSENIETQQKVTNKTVISEDNSSEIKIDHSKSQIRTPLLNLPAPKNEKSSEILNENEDTDYEKGSENKLGLLGALPKPTVSVSVCSTEDIIEEDIPISETKELVIADDGIPLIIPKRHVPEKTAKIKAPARISIPSLSDFKDVDEDLGKSKTRPSQNAMSGHRSRLVTILPPPKSEIVSDKKNNFVPHVLTKKVTNPVPKKPATITKVPVNKAKDVKNPLSMLGYNSDSNSEDEDNDEGGKRDFFALSKPVTVPESAISAASNFFSISEDKQNEDSMTDMERKFAMSAAKDFDGSEYKTVENDQTQVSDKTLVSTVMNMPLEEILLKNKAEVGPKLPVPEQEYNVDSEGNVAFDDKAIEYLCGKRGVKRKNQMIEEANIIEINGEDIKPDEREWLVKALTEEPVQRPVSMQGAGPSSQSKKKHQITYLAHQAKAMEVELKNTWSQNRMTRKQTQSKYGF